MGKLIMNGVVYGGADGGGGGAGGSSVYSEKELYKASNTTFANIQVDFTKDYDAYIFYCNDVITQKSESYFYTKGEIEDAIANNLIISMYPFGSAGYCQYNISDSGLTTNANRGGFILYKIVGLKFGTLSPIIYSEEEREVGVWIDNKPLYQITYDAGSNIDVKYNSWTNITINELMGSENIVMGYGTNSGGTYTPLQVSWTGSVGSKIIQVQTPRNSNNQGVRYFTILYTKTTDVAESGTYTTMGTPAVHYSTDEQVIGTWIDGRPIYQKIITYDSTINSNTWATIDNSITTAIVDHFFVDNIDWQYSSYIVGGANTGGGGLNTTLTANGLSLENQTPVAGSNFTLIVKYTKIADIQSS